MKKRMLSLLLVLCLLLSALPMTALAGEAKLYGTVPIYIGYVDLDYMAEQILQEIGVSGGTDRERILAVYNWIIRNCRRTGAADKQYFDMDEVLEKSSGTFLDRMEQDFMDGKLTFRIDRSGRDGAFRQVVFNKDGSESPLLMFTDQRFEQVDFVALSAYMTLHVNARFRNERVLNLLREQGSVAMINNTLRILNREKKA